MTREAFYKATVAQVTQTTALVTMIKGAAPPDPTPAVKQAYAHRMLAGSLLAQAATAMQTFLETGDKDSGAQSSLWLTECQKELSAIK
jgi:hypothetical protein